MIVIAAIDNKQQPLGFGSRCCQLWQWRQQLLTAAIAAVIVDHRAGGLTNLDGGQRSRQGATDNTTTNHQQERQRGDDVGKGCSDGDGGGKGKGVVAAALAVGHHPVVIVDSGGKDVIATPSINCRCSRR